MECASKFFIVDLPDHTNEILALSQKVEEYGKDDYIDGQILANALKFVFWTGLKRSKFPILKIGDVTCQGTGEIVSGIEIGHREVIIFEDLKTLIQNHLAYLKIAGYKTTRAQPLFPKTRKSSLKHNSTDKNRFYDDGTMSLHIRKCLKVTEFSFQGFESIRQAGICSYFIRLKESGALSPDECLLETTFFARYNDQKEVIRIIKGFMPSEGDNRSSIYDDIPKLSLAYFENRTWIIPYGQYKLCIKFSLPRIFKDGSIFPRLAVYDRESMTKITKNFVKSLHMNDHLDDNQKRELKIDFVNTIKEAYRIWKDSK